jgi:hypothetical protein
MRSKVILSVLVCLALLLSLGVAVKDVKADAILFPWVIKNTGTTSTLISVVNTTGIPVRGVYQVSGIPLDLHYEYHWKTGGQTVKCEEWDFLRPTSKDDIVTFDAAGFFNSGKPLFNDNTNDVPYGPEGFDMGVGVPSPARAFLIVDNNTTALSGQSGVVPLTSPINMDGTLYGEALILQLVDGSAWGYIAYNPSGGQTTNPSDPVDFSNANEMLGEVIANLQTPSGSISAIVNPDERVPVVFMPANTIKTKLFVTPIDAGFGTYSVDNSVSQTDDTANTTLNQRKDNINTAVELYYMTSTQTLSGGMWDNDENPISFTTRKNIVCTSADLLSAFVDQGVYDAWKLKGTQAWAFLMTFPGTVDANANGVPDNPEMQAVIGKLEYSDDTQSLVIGGNLVAGTQNNFNWLRNSQGRLSCGGINCISNLSPGHTSVN